MIATALQTVFSYGTSRRSTPIARPVVLAFATGHVTGVLIQCRNAFPVARTILRTYWFCTILTVPMFGTVAQTRSFIAQATRGAAIGAVLVFTRKTKPVGRTCTGMVDVVAFTVHTTILQTSTH